MCQSWSANSKNADGCWENVGGQLVSAGPAMHLHLSPPADVRLARLCPPPPRTTPLWALRPTEREGERMKDEVAPPSNLMTQRSLLWLHVHSPLTLLFFPPPLPISRAAHQSALVSGFFSSSRSARASLCGFARTDMFNFNYLGKVSEAGGGYLKGNII